MAEPLDDRPVIFTDAVDYGARSGVFYRGEGQTLYERGRSQAVMLKAGFDIPAGVTLDKRDVAEALGERNGLYRAGAPVADHAAERIIFIPIQIC